MHSVSLPSSDTETDVGDATTGTQFTDATGSVNVKFTIDCGATPYAVGDTYTFVVWDASGDAGTAKTVTMMQEGDTLTVPVNTTLELKGASGNLTTVTRGGASTDGYSIDVSGVIDASYYTLSYLKGPTDGFGLDLQSTATVTNLANGTFDNYQNVGATDAYLRVHSSLIGALSPTKSFAGLVFTQNGAGLPEYTITESGGTTGGGYWDFCSTTCTGWASCDASTSEANGDTLRFCAAAGARKPRPSGSGQYPAIY